MSTWQDQLATGVPQFAPCADPAAVGHLIAYLDLLRKWNRAYNLTAVDDPARMVVMHVLDSLAILPHLHGRRLVDIGTGAGLPGLVLAITDPGLSVTLIDSNAKKTAFCAYVVDTLGLANVQVVHSRAEYHRPDATFDTVVSRAFAALSVFVEQAGHLCAAGGRMLAMKGTLPTGELVELPQGWRVNAIHPLVVPSLDAERHLIVIERS